MPKRQHIITKLSKPRSYKVTHSKNIRSLRRTRLTKSKMDLKLYEKQLKTLGDEIILLDPVEDFEIYQVKTKLIYVLILELMLDGVAASMALANKYSDKTGIKVDIRAFRKKSRKHLPSIRSIVKQAKEQGKKPDAGTIAAGYRW
jgi:hypothetical protein